MEVLASIPLCIGSQGPPRARRPGWSRAGSPGRDREGTLPCRGHGLWGGEDWLVMRQQVTSQERPPRGDEQILRRCLDFSSCYHPTEVRIYRNEGKTAYLVYDQGDISVPFNSGTRSTPPPQTLKPVP